MQAMAVGEITPPMLASTFIAMVGTIGVMVDSAGVTLGYGIAGVMVDSMDGAGTGHGDGTDGTIGAGEVTTDMATVMDGAVIITHGIILITVTDMVITAIEIMVVMATMEITPIIGADVAITIPIPLQAIVQQEI